MSPRPDLVELLQFIRGGLADHEARRFALRVMDDPVLVDWVRWLSDVDQAASMLQFDPVPPEVTNALYDMFDGGGTATARLRADSRDALIGTRTTTSAVDGSFTLVLSAAPGELVVDVFDDGSGRWAQVDMVRPDGSRAVIGGGRLASGDTSIEGVLNSGRLEFHRIPPGPTRLVVMVDGGRVQAEFEEGW